MRRLIKETVFDRLMGTSRRHFIIKSMTIAGLGAFYLATPSTILFGEKEKNEGQDDSTINDNLVAKARKAVEESYSNRVDIEKYENLTTLLHMYLARIPPFTGDTSKVTSSIESLLSNGKIDRGEAHVGQLYKLLHLLADDGIITQNTAIEKEKVKSTYLNDTSLAEYLARNLSLSDKYSPSLDIVAWNLINVRSLPLEKRITNHFGETFEIGDVMNDVYAQLCFYEKPVQELKSGPKTSNLAKNEVEYSSHGIIGYLSYVKANPNEQTGSEAERLYHILVKKISEKLKEDKDDAHALGHYLEATARTIKMFPQIDYNADRQTLTEAVNSLANSLATSSWAVSLLKKYNLFALAASNEVKTHALIGCEMMYGILKKN